jgi:hypothetical protein
VELSGILTLIGVVIGANIGRDSESGRHRKPDSGHFCEVGSFPPRRAFIEAVAISLFIPNV